MMLVQATQAADRDRILQEIQASIGATKLNLELKRSLVDSARCVRDLVLCTPQLENEMPLANACVQA